MLYRTFYIAADALHYNVSETANALCAKCQLIFYFLFLGFADDDMQITGHLYTHLMHAVGLVVVLVHRAHRHVYKPSD